MKQNILVRGARQLLTLQGPSGPRRGAALNNLGLIEDGAVLVVDGTISSIGLSRRVENLAEARVAMEIDATGRVVMPGFIDSNTNLFGGFPQPDEGSFDPLQFFPPARAVHGAPARALDSRARKFLHSCARHGTTTVEAQSGYGLDEVSELKMLKILSELSDDPITVVSTYVMVEFQQNAETYLDWVKDKLLPKVAQRKLARFAGIVCAPGGPSLEAMSGYLKAAKQLGLPGKVQTQLQSHRDCVRLAVDMDAASVDGLNHATESDAQMLAGSNVIATLLPADVFHHAAAQPAPARTLVDQGAAIALASGFHHDKMPSYNMQFILSIASKFLNLSAAEAISAVTINAAHALRTEATSGSLQYGKDADLIMLDVTDYRELSHYTGGNLVSMTMRKGEVIYREPEVSWPEK